MALVRGLMAYQLVLALVVVAGLSVSAPVSCWCVTDDHLGQVLHPLFPHSHGSDVVGAHARGSHGHGVAGPDERLSDRSLHDGRAGRAVDVESGWQAPAGTGPLAAFVTNGLALSAPTLADLSAGRRWAGSIEELRPGDYLPGVATPPPRP